MEPAAPSLTTLFDVDNTLLDNDRAKAELDGALGALLGDDGRADFWRLYEAIRRETGRVDIPLTLARIDAASPNPARRMALADLFMRFPYEDYLFPDARSAVAHARRFGAVAILSDGDPIFQPNKIWRAGLTAAVDGAVVVVEHKERRMPEVAAAYPAARYLLVDDKPALLRAMAAALPAPATTIWVRKGHYAANAPAADWRPDVALDAIGELTRLDLNALPPALDSPARP
jgi:FMN phosphatase YigB (HAD superfamily)